MPGSPQHAIKVKDKNKADSKKGIKVHSVSVLYSRKESEDKNSSCQFVVWCGTPDWQLAWSYQGLSGWQWGPEDYSTEQLSRDKMSIYSSQSEHKFVCMPVGGKSERCGSRGWRMKGALLRHIHVLFCIKGPVVSQHAAAQGYASRVFPACLRHLSRVSNHLRPTEPPASEPSRISVCR